MQSHQLKIASLPHFIHPVIPSCQFGHQRGSVTCLEIIYVYEFRINVKSRLFCNLLLPTQSRRSEPFGVARAACFEQLACIFASCGAPLEKTDDTLTKKRTILC